MSPMSPEAYHESVTVFQLPDGRWQVQAARGCVYLLDQYATRPEAERKAERQRAEWAEEARHQAAWLASIQDR